MITLYSGTPGSGKSLHAAYKMIDFIKFGKNVIGNFAIDETFFNRGRKKQRPAPARYGQYIYRPNHKLTPDWLVDYARKNHKVGKEGQSLIIIDECAVMFNSRDWSKKDRMQWIKFFQTHRHFGYDIILISQHDRMIDRQIRAFIETERKHRCAKNYKLIGFILYHLFGGFFVSIEYWYGCNLFCSSEFFRLNRKKAKIYNAFAMFDEFEQLN